MQEIEEFISDRFGNLYKGLYGSYYRHKASFEFKEDADEFFQFLATDSCSLARFPVRKGNGCYIVEFKTR